MTTIEKKISVTPLRTSFQVQNDLQQQLDEVARIATERGIDIGKKLGERSVDMALGVGVCLGMAFGVLAAVTAIGWFS